VTAPYRTVLRLSGRINIKAPHYLHMKASIYLTAQPAKYHPDMQGLDLKLNWESPVDSYIAVEMREQALNARER
jgi:hypothetical protein